MPAFHFKMQIILNIKGIRAKLHTDSPKTVCISVTEGRTGKLTAGDIVHDDGVEIMSPDHVIATLNGLKNGMASYLNIIWVAVHL